MTPDEALSYGLIDQVIQHKKMIARPKIPSLKVFILQFFGAIFILYAFLIIY